jgi:hypothetical protein
MATMSWPHVVVLFAALGDTSAMGGCAPWNVGILGVIVSSCRCACAAVVTGNNVVPVVHFVGIVGVVFV